jgi:hypothetical protein
MPQQYSTPVTSDPTPPQEQASPSTVGDAVARPDFAAAAGRLTRLQELRDQGLISEEEFASSRKRLLEGH